MLFIVILLTSVVLAMVLIERHRTPQVFLRFMDKRFDEKLFTAWDEEHARSCKHFQKLQQDWLELTESEIWYRYNLSHIGFTITTPGAASAYRWYSKHWQKTGEGSSAYMLGVLCLTGLGTETSATAALAWFRIAEEKGVVNALTAQGIMRLRALESATSGNSSKEPETAADWPDFGDAEASRKEAFLLFQQAVTWADPIAHLNLGYCHELGLGTAINLNSAMKHYLMAANKGNTAAQYRLSLLYSAQNNPVQAYLWAYVASVCAESEIPRNRYQALAETMDEATRTYANQLAAYTSQTVVGPQIERLLKASRMITTMGH